VHVARKEERYKDRSERLKREFFEQGRLPNSPHRRSGSSGDRSVFASVEPLPGRNLPVVDWEIDTREEGD